MAEIAKLIATVGADTSDFESGMNRANGVLGNMGGIMRTALVGAAAAGGAALVGLGAKSVTVAADFESQMNVLSVAAAGGGASLEDLRSAALTMGSDVSLVGINASQSADAMTNFAKAGLDTTAMFGDLQGYLSGTAELGGALRAAVDLAAASELDLAGASELVTIAMSTFGISADEAVGIANSFVQAADGSVASVGDLAAAMTTLGPTAASMGMSLDETNTALAILSTRGISGAEAGTALKSMLMNMQSQSTSTLATWKALGVSMYDAEGNMNSLETIIGDLEVAMSGMTMEQRNLTMENLAGQYGIKALNTLLAEGATGYNDMELAISNAATAQESAAARTQGFQAATEQLGGAVETFMINVGTPLIENFLTPGVQLLTEWITELGNMVPSQEAVSAAFETVKSAIGGVIDTITTIVSSDDPLGTLWTMIKDGIAAAWPGIQTTLETAVTGMVSSATTYVTSNAPTWASSLWAALQSWVDTAVAYVSGNASAWGGTIGSLLGTAVSGAVEWVTTNAPVYAASLWASLQGWIDGAVAYVGDNYQSWGDSIGSWLGDALSAAAGWLVTNYVTYLTFLWNSFNTIFNALVDYVGANYQAWGDSIGAWLGSALSAAATWLTTNIGPYVTSLWESVKSWIGGATESLGASAVTLGDSIGAKLGEMVSAAVTWVTTNGPTYASELWASLGGFLDSALTLFSDNAATAGATFGETLGTVVRYAIGGLVTGAAALISLLWDALSGVFSGATSDEGGEKSSVLGQALLDLFTGILNGFMVGLTADPQWATKLGDWVDTTIVQPFRDIDLIAPIKTVFSGIITGVNEKAEEVSTAITDIVNRIIDPLKAIDLMQIGRDMFTGLKNGIADAAGSVSDAVSNAAGNAVSTAKNFLGIGSPSKVFAAIGRDMMAGMELGIERNTYRPREAIGQASSNVSNTFNLNANYGGQMPSSLEGLLTQLLQGMRGRGYSVPLPDMGGA